MIFLPLALFAGVFPGPPGVAAALPRLLTGVVFLLIRATATSWPRGDGLRPLNGTLVVFVRVVLLRFEWWACSLPESSRSASTYTWMRHGERVGVFTMVVCESFLLLLSGESETEEVRLMVRGATGVAW